MQNAKRIASGGPTTPTSANGRDMPSMSPRTLTANSAVCSRVSMATARKRLPMPAIGSTSVICSGVSIFRRSPDCTVISTHWLDARRAYWIRLERLLDAASRRGFASLTRGELQELGLLYRQLGSDLATLRTDPSSIGFADDLQRLLARAHHTIYSSERRRPMAAARELFLTYP